MGNCTSKQFVADLGLQSKTYTAEESALIARETFASSIILRDAVPLEGEVTVNDPRPFVTFHEGVIAKKLLRRDSLRIETRSRATDGRRMDQCGFNPTSPQLNTIAEALVVQEWGAESEYCVKDMLPTYKQAAVKRQALNAGNDGWESPWLTLEFEYAVLRKMRDDVDKHSFMGDYGTGDKFRTHTDGFVKDIVLSSASVKTSKAEWLFTGDLTDTCIEYKIGAVEDSVPFNTSMTQTLADFVTKITVTDAAKFLDVNGVAIFESVTSTATKILIEMAMPYDIAFQVQLVLTNCDGFYICADGSLKANSAVTGPTMTFTQTQKLVTGEQPISFDWDAITPLNVLDKLNGMMAEIALKKPELLSAPDFTLFVAPNVMTAYLIAVKQSNQGTVGAGGQMPQVTTIWQGTQMQQLNFGMLPNDFIIGARPSSLHFGTYLRRDMDAWQTYVTPMCQNVQFKMQAHMGFKTTRRDEIVGTFTETAQHSFNFGARQPDPFEV